MSAMLCAPSPMVPRGSRCTRCTAVTAARLGCALPAEDIPALHQSRGASAHNRPMTTRSAPAACRLGPADTARLGALLDRDPVANAYLRSELRLGLDNG